MDKTKFMGIQKYNGYSSKKTAEELGITPQTLSRMINQVDGSDFKRLQIEKIKDLWKLSNEQVSEIFFKKKVSGNDTNE